MDLRHDNAPQAAPFERTPVEDPRTFNPMETGHGQHTQSERLVITRSPVITVEASLTKGWALKEYVTNSVDTAKHLRDWDVDSMGPMSIQSSCGVQEGVFGDVSDDVFDMGDHVTNPPPPTPQEVMMPAGLSMPTLPVIHEGEFEDVSDDALDMDDHVTNPPPPTPQEVMMPAGLSMPTLPAMHLMSDPMLGEQYGIMPSLNAAVSDEQTEYTKHSLVRPKVSHEPFRTKPFVGNKEYAAELASRQDAIRVHEWLNQTNKEAFWGSPTMSSHGEDMVSPGEDMISPGRDTNPTTRPVTIPPISNRDEDRYEFPESTTSIPDYESGRLSQTPVNQLLMDPANKSSKPIKMVKPTKTKEVRQHLESRLQSAIPEAVAPATTANATFTHQECVTTEVNEQVEIHTVKTSIEITEVYEVIRRAPGMPNSTHFPYAENLPNAGINAQLAEDEQSENDSQTDVRDEDIMLFDLYEQFSPHYRVLHRQSPAPSVTESGDE